MKVGVSKDVRLTDLQRLRLINMLLNDQVISKDKEIASLLSELAKLRLENANFRAMIHDRDVTAFYSEVGAKKSDQLDLKDDGTLTVTELRDKPENQPLNGSQRK